MESLDTDRHVGYLVGAKCRKVWGYSDAQMVFEVIWKCCGGEVPGQLCKVEEVESAKHSQKAVVFVGPVVLA